MPKYIAWDTETFPIEPGNLWPRPVCSTYCFENEDPWIVDPAQTYDDLDCDWHFVTANGAFDFAVFFRHFPDLRPRIFELYAEGKVTDIQTREKLLAIREGRFEHTKYSLSDLSQQYRGWPLSKGADTWRLRYQELADTPIETWPEDAKNYALLDAKATMEVFQAQQKILAVEPLPPGEEARQNRAHFALHLMSCQGLITDAQAVAALEQSLQGTIDEHMQALIDAKIYRPKHKIKRPSPWQKDVKLIRTKVEASFRAKDKSPPTTEKGATQYSEEVLRDTDDPDLLHLADISKAQKIQSTYLPILKQRTTTPVGCRYNVIVGTGRTSSYNPNDQNPPNFGGVRECYVPHPGKVFISADYDAAELKALAQIHLWLFKHSAMADAFIAGKDLHLMVAARMANLTYAQAKIKYDAGDPELEKKRKFAKILNFGLAGGMGVDTFMKHSKTHKFPISREVAYEGIQAFMSTWTEMPTYLNRCAEAVSFGPARQKHWVSNRVRANCGYSQYANGQFQGLIADGAKEACWNVTLACYNEPNSALYGSTPVLFMHDQIMCEAPIERATEAAEELARVMCASLQKWIPDVPITASPVIMTRWFKGAKTKRDPEGRLIPWK